MIKTINIINVTSPLTFVSGGICNRYVIKNKIIKYVHFIIFLKLKLKKKLIDIVSTENIIKNITKLKN